MRKILASAFIILFCLFLALPVFAQPFSEQITDYRVKIQIEKNSSIKVKENIEYYFPEAKHGIYRYLPYNYEDKQNKRYLNLDYEFLGILMDNQPIEYQKSKKEGNWLLKIGDPGKTVTGSHLYTINYEVQYTLNYFSDHDELYWNVTGSDWEVAIKQVEAEVVLPENIATEVLQTQCYTSSSYCQCATTKDKTKITFKSNSPITVVVGWPKGITEEVKKPYHRLLPFIHYRVESAWFLLFPLIFLIYFVWFFLKKGRDPRGRGTIAPEFEIPDDLPPAEMGTVLDEVASNREVTATLIDLAVKGYLEIKDLGEKGFFKKRDFLFKRTDKDETELKEYEKKILKAIFLDTKEIKLSDLKTKHNSEISESLDEAKKNMYETAFSNGWFTAMPTKIRTSYFGCGCGLGIFALVILILSAAMNKFSMILGLDFVIIGLVVAAFAWFMPQKTKKGVLIKERILGFKMYMEKAEIYRSQWQEKENILEKFLSYAILFGVTGQWLKALKNIGLPVEKTFENATFYTGAYAFSDLSSSLDSLGTNVNAAMGSVSSSAASGGSGFSGGGFGGGFGGGGGGSW